MNLARSAGGTRTTTTTEPRRGPRAAAQATFLCTAAIALAALWTVHAVAEGRRSTPLPITLDPPGSVASRSFGITDSGDIVGLSITADTKVHGFLLTRGVYTSIDGPGAIRTNAIGVAELRPESKTDDDDHDSFHAGRYRRLAVVGRYDTPNPANPANAIAHGYALRDGTLTIIDHPGTHTFTVAAGINSSGQIVGRYLSAEDNQFHGFLLADGEFTTIDYPGAMAMNGIAINNKGDIAGYYGNSDGRSHAFVLRDGVFTTIDPPDSLGTGQNGGVIGINTQEVVGYYRFQPATSSSDGLRAFVYSLRDGSWTTFALPEPVRATCFFGINRHGDIVGNFVDADRHEHSLLLQRADDR
jgi:uncharacterized membrane protein